MFEDKKIEEIEQFFSCSSTSGLSEIEAEKRLLKDGPNILNSEKKQNIIVKFLLQFKDPMIYVLLGAGVISFCLKEWADGIIIVSVILLNAIIGTIQEAKAEKALEALKKMSSPSCVVKRDGKIKEIKAEDLVVGDLVVLEEGRIVPADLRLVETINMKVDESSLTGESIPVEKNADIILNENSGIGDRKNMAFMSTPVSYGRGEGIVVSTGMNTEIGHIAKMLKDAKDNKTPLQQKLASLSKILGIVCVSVCVLMYAVGLLYAVFGPNKQDIGTASLDLLITAISVAVAAIPEGLPAVVTIVLAIGVSRMVKVNTIVKHLPSVETLGAVTVICSDKTGTLTQNKMTIEKTYINGKIKDANEVDAEEVKLLAQGMMLCSNASIKDERYGDPTELALLDYAKKFGWNKEEIEENKYQRLDELPFDSVRKMMSVLSHYEGKNIVFTKGALDSILKHTKNIYLDGKVRKITEKDISTINENSKIMAKQAYRVLALAIHESNVVDEENLTFVGMVGMIDPAREEAKPAVECLHKAGIRTIMITGDHKDTALAIAKNLNIATDEKQCMSGDEIDSLSMELLEEKVKTTNVFARVSPENKVNIVKALQNSGNIVAMTGDGVNDAPSLKTADIGIAMGITGTDVAKGAADMTLMDDNFASIEKAVEEGRSIYSNIKKAIFFLLSSNFGEVMTMFFAACIGFPSPLRAIHILWVNLISDSLPALALGRDDKDSDIMNLKPRPVNEGLFAHHGFSFCFFYGFIIFLITMIAFLINPLIDLNAPGSVGFTWNNLLIYLQNDAQLDKCQTFAFTVLGMSQLFHMLGMSNVKKSFVNVFKGKNIMFLISFIFGLTLQILVTELPYVTDFFQTTALEWYEWLWLIALSSFPLIVHELLVPVLRKSKLQF